MSFEDCSLQRNRWGLDCSYFPETFPTLQELIDYVLLVGQDPNYEIVFNDKPFGEKLSSFFLLP